MEQTEAQRAEADVDMCVTDLSVAVEIDHDCIQQLHLTLYGPGPPPGDTSRLGDVSRAEPAVLVLGGGIADCASDFDLFGDGNDGTAGDVSYGGCVDGMDVSFEDSAESGVWEGCNNRRYARAGDGVRCLTVATSSISAIYILARHAGAMYEVHATRP